MPHATMPHATGRPCGCPKTRQARASAPTGTGYVLVVHPSGETAHVRADVARALAASDPQSRTVGTRRDGTLAGAPGEIVYLSGFWGSIFRGARAVVGAAAAPAGAIVGGVTGGPAGAAAGWGVGSAVGNAARNPTAAERLARRAQQIATKAARLGLQLDEPTAVWLAGQTDRQVDAWLNQARQRQNAAMEASVAAQIAAAQRAGMAPAPAPTYGLPPADPAAQNTGGGAASLFGSPLVLGAAALAAVLLLKK